MSNDKPDWLKELEAEDKRRRDRLLAAKHAILAALKLTRTATITIEYDGEGDSGQVSGIAAISATGRLVKLRGTVTLDLDGTPQRYGDLEHALDAFAWAVLGVHHDGFVNNDGGFGTIAIDVASGTVTIDHNDRITDVCHTRTEV